MAEKNEWKLIPIGKNSLMFEREEKIATIVPTGKDDLYHLILEDNVIPSDVNALMFISKEKVIEILGFNPWYNRRIN